MDSSTKDIFDKLESLKAEDEQGLSYKRNALLKDAYSGKDAVILTCGPSLSLVWNDQLNDFLKDKLIISVKQAHFQNPLISDFHIYNEVRMENYSYPAKTIRLSVSQLQKDHPSHIHYPIHSYKYEDAVFVTNNYEDWSLDKNVERPWGIGIMFELGLFLPIHFGCKRVVIIGFDMNHKGKFHFYDNDTKQDSSYYKVDRDEFKYVQSSLPHYIKWTKELGIEVKLFSPLSVLPIPRIDDIQGYLK